MSEKYRDEARVEHMYRSIERIRQILQHVEPESFVEGNDSAELILYHLVLLGEAANNVSAEFCAANPSVDFKDMAGLRHKLVHDYANIDMDIIWDVVKNDIPVQYPVVKALADSIPVPAKPDNIDEFA